jgi:DNA modification methylase
MNKLYRGDCLKILRRLPDESVQCCVTSPPYWGLRDYGTAKWQGGNAECDHSPRAHQSTAKSNGTDALRDKPGQICKCGARRIDQQLGLESTPEAYIARMVEVFGEVRRVLRDDGTLWLNIGDTFNSSPSNQQGRKGTSSGLISSKYASDGMAGNGRQHRDVPGLKSKDLVGIPWRLAFALQADGWYLRSDIIWHKPNPMPESVTDRPTKAHEYVFLLTKSARYFWDAEAVRESGTGRSTGNKNVKGAGEPGFEIRDGFLKVADVEWHTRNIRSVWQITPKPFRGAHFATFPPALVERCVKAGTSERGCCPHCGKAWERVTKHSPMILRRSERTHSMGRTRSSGTMLEPPRSKTLGFRPACDCPAAAPVPCVVLDPFIGSGTTAAVAKALGRDCVGIDLNPKYLTMARARIKAEQARVA